MPRRMGGRSRPAGDEDGSAATRCLDVWEWEGGASPDAADAVLDPHATLYEYPSTGPARRTSWDLFASAGRALRPRAHWASFLALGAGVLAVGWLGQRARG
jgi:hypothetical protein